MQPEIHSFCWESCNQPEVSLYSLHSWPLDESRLLFGRIMFSHFVPECVFDINQTLWGMRAAKSSCDADDVSQNVTEVAPGGRLGEKFQFLFMSFLRKRQRYGCPHNIHRASARLNRSKCLRCDLCRTFVHFMSLYLSSALSLSLAPPSAIASLYQTCQIISGGLSTILLNVIFEKFPLSDRRQLTSGLICNVKICYGGNL